MRKNLFINRSIIFIFLFFSISELTNINAQQPDSTSEFLHYKRNDSTFLENYNPNDKEKYFPLRSTGIWTELNPNVPRVDYIGVDFINPDTGWAVGLWGAAIKTTNGGQNWTTLETPTGEILLKVHSPATAGKYNGQVVIAVGHKGTVLRSSDGGDSFTLLTGITTQELWGVQMLNDTLGWICGRNQTLLKTTDAGLTWQPVVTGFNYHYWQFDFLTEDYFMIACSQGRVLKTTNGGQSFTQHQAGSTQDLYTINIIDSLHIAAAGNVGKNVYSSDGGVTWTENQYTALSINWIQYINRDTGYITIGTVHLHKTTNRGQSWFNPGFNATGEWQFELLNENIGYGVGAGLTVTKTEDGFNTGENLFLKHNWSDVFFVSEQKGFLSSIDLGVKLYKTEDGGNTFQIIENSPSRIYDILFLDSLTGFLGSNTIYKTTDGGENWYSVNVAPGNIGKIFFINPLTGWATSGRNILKTTDGGENWVVQFTHITLGFSSIHFVDSLYGWTSGGRPQKTSNGGISWIEQTNTSIWNSQDVYFSNIDTGWIVKSSFNSSLLKTTDSGINWMAVSEVIGAYGFHFFPDPLHWMINGSRRYITEDGGNTFIDITDDVSTGFGSFGAVTDKLGYAVGSFGLILRYDDTSYVPVELISFEAKTDEDKIILSWATASELNNQGFYIEKSYDKMNWETIGFINGNGTTTETNDYSFIDRQVFNGENNYRLKQIDFDGSFTYSEVVSVYYKNLPINFELFQNYPNPFNPKTIIKYTIAQNDMVKISFYSILGDKIIDLVNEEKQAGVYTITFDANNLASGVYMYKMITGSGYTTVKKLSIIK